MLLHRERGERRPSSRLQRKDRANNVLDIVSVIAAAVTVSFGAIDILETFAAFFEKKFEARLARKPTRS